MPAFCGGMIGPGALSEGGAPGVGAAGAAGVRAAIPSSPPMLRSVDGVMVNPAEMSVRKGENLVPRYPTAPSQRLFVNCRFSPGSRSEPTVLDMDCVCQPVSP